LLIWHSKYSQNTLLQTAFSAERRIIKYIVTFLSGQENFVAIFDNTLLRFSRSGPNEIRWVALLLCLAWLKPTKRSL